MTDPNSLAPLDADDSRPPIGGSWRTLYIAVLVNLCVMITVFYAFTRLMR